MLLAVEKNLSENANLRVKDILADFFLLQKTDDLFEVLGECNIQLAFFQVSSQFTALLDVLFCLLSARVFSGTFLFFT